MSDPLKDLRDCEAAFVEAGLNMFIWREAAQFCLPRNASGIGGSSQTPYQPVATMQNSTAIDALETLASGMASSICPATSEWFAWTPAPQVDFDEVADWLQQCTKIAHLALGRSNFYSRLQEFLLDAGCTGTSVLMFEGKKGNVDLSFDVWDIGTYAIAEDAAGTVNRVWRKWELTVEQAETLWGSALPAKLLEMDSAAKLTTKEMFVVYIGPRDEDDRAELGPRSMPFETCVIHMSSKTEVWEGGFEEWPAISYRFLRQSGKSPWGVGPGVMALCDERGCNYLEGKLADALNKAITPPLAITDNIRGAIDLRAGGITMVSDMSQRPQVMSEVGNVTMGERMLDKKEAQLKRYFHTDLFQLFTGLDKAMTRYEAMQLKDEKLNRFGQPFHRYITEVNNPLLERLFMVLFRQGSFPPPPRKAIVQTAGGPMLIYPTIVQTSPMAMAIKALEQQSFREYLADLMPVAQVDPSVLDNIDFNKASRMMGRSSAALAGVLRPQAEVDAMREAKAQQAQQQQMMQMAGQVAAKNPEMLAGALGAGGGQ